jgi:plastocyanin
MTSVAKSLIYALLTAVPTLTLPAIALAHQSITGKILIEDGKPLTSPIILYLEPQDRSLAAKPQKHKISQKGRKFDPDLQVIVVGDVVQFLNDENQEIDHNIYSMSDAKTFDLGLGARGSVMEAGFENAGILNYYCSVHKRMEGRLVILPSPHFTAPQQSGDFIFSGAPAGRWWLKAIILNPRYTVDPAPVIVGEEPVKDLVLKITKKR